VAQAKPTIGTRADAKCLAEAAKTVEQPGFNPSNYTFHGGTEDDNNFEGQATAGPDVFCGFGGDDFIRTLDEGDIFLGGAGNDTVRDNFGTAYGQEGDDQVVFNFTGIFYGGAGNDFVLNNQSTFNGGPGDDTVGGGNPP
jgi:RTX calcium-binding nonapeptide repeat (4 copies)